MGGLIGFIVDKLRERSDKQGTYGESYEGRLGETSTRTEVILVNSR